jgi:hypothetical protein
MRIFSGPDDGPDVSSGTSLSVFTACTMVGSGSRTTRRLPRPAVRRSNAVQALKSNRKNA